MASGATMESVGAGTGVSAVPPQATHTVTATITAGRTATLSILLLSMKLTIYPHPCAANLLSLIILKRRCLISYDTGAKVNYVANRFLGSFLQVLPCQDLGSKCKNPVRECDSEPVIFSGSCSCGLVVTFGLR